MLNLNLSEYHYENTGGQVVVGRLTAPNRPDLFVVRQSRGFFVTDANGRIMQPWRPNNTPAVSVPSSETIGSC